jgi:hypothetical protein
MMISANVDIIKPKLALTWDGTDGAHHTALVMAVDKNATLGAVTALLAARWDLPAKQDKPAAYDLYTADEELVDPAETLGRLDLGKNAVLRLVAANPPAVSQLPVDIPVFDVQHPDAQTSLSILAALSEVTVSELESTLVDRWQLPEQEFEYYELRHPDGQPLPLNKRLCDAGVVDQGRLLLTRQEGVRATLDENSAGVYPDLQGLLNLTNSLHAQMSDEDLLTAARQWLPEETLRGKEKEFLALTRQIWRQLLAGQAQSPQPLVDSDDVITVDIPPE